MTSIKSIRKSRYMPFIKRGMRVLHTHTNRYGRITGGNESCNLQVKFDGDKYSQNCHPKFKMIYFDKKGNIIKSYD